MCHYFYTLQNSSEDMCGMHCLSGYHRHGKMRPVFLIHTASLSLHMTFPDQIPGGKQNSLSFIHAPVSVAPVLLV